MAMIPPKVLLKKVDLAFLGKRYLMHEATSTLYKSATKQNLEYIPHGTYNLSAWVGSSGGQKTAQMRVIVGDKERYYAIPASQK